jgi:HSP20 family molecular chaperone IbpA
MRTYDFAPLWRSSIGFDRLFDLLTDTQRLETQDNYPPYDIVRTGEETYCISLALAGFSPEGRQRHGAAEHADGGGPQVRAGDSEIWS